MPTYDVTIPVIIRVDGDTKSLAKEHATDLLLDILRGTEAPTWVSDPAAVKAHRFRRFHPTDEK